MYYYFNIRYIQGIILYYPQYILIILITSNDYGDIHPTPKPVDFSLKINYD